MILDAKTFSKLSSGAAIQKRCPVCLSVFYAFNPRAVYCSNSCKQASYRKRLNTGSGFENNLEGISETEFDNDNSNFQNDITMADSQLIAQIERNSSLNLDLQLTKRDLEDCRKQLKTFEDQSKHIGKLQTEIETLEEEKSELDEAVKSLNDSYDRLNAKLLVTEKKYQKESLENLFRSAIINRSTVTVAKVKEVLPEFAQTELSTEIDGYKIILRKGENQFIIKKI